MENANSIVGLAIQVKYPITKHVNVNVKVIAHGKKIIVGILAHALAKIASILKKVFKKVLLMLQ